MKDKAEQRKQIERHIQGIHWAGRMAERSERLGRELLQLRDGKMPKILQGDLAHLRPIAAAMEEIGLPVHRHTVNRWCLSKRISAVRIGGRWFVDPEELRKVVKEQGA